jgi:hypothetical protein
MPLHPVGGDLPRRSERHRLECAGDVDALSGDPQPARRIVTIEPEGFALRKMGSRCMPHSSDDYGASLRRNRQATNSLAAARVRKPPSTTSVFLGTAAVFVACPGSPVAVDDAAADRPSAPSSAARYALGVNAGVRARAATLT